jgi:hypothetical protein
MSTHKKYLTSRQKGKKSEQAFYDYMRYRGWTLYKQPLPKNRNNSKDIFNVFDYLCMKEDQIKLVQVKSSKEGQRAGVRKIKKWSSVNNITFKNMEVWCKINNKWDIIII